MWKNEISGEISLEEEVRKMEDTKPADLSGLVKIEMEKEPQARDEIF